MGLVLKIHSLTQVLAIKFGYSNVEKMKIDSRERFSLLENGILDMPSTKLLLINGMLDELFPIEDCMLPLQYGSVKDARFFQGSKHMGEPHARKFILEWVKDLFATVGPKQKLLNGINGVNGVNGVH